MGHVTTSTQWHVCGWLIAVNSEDSSQDSKDDDDDDDDDDQAADGNSSVNG